MSVLITRETVREHSNWILTGGIVVVLAGLLAIFFAGSSTLIAMAVLGSVLLVRGGIELGLSARVGFHRGFGYHLFLGVLSIVVGAFVLYDPVGNAVVLTLLIGIFFFINGLSRFAASLVMRGHSWGRIALSGVVSMIVGALVFLTWPVASVWTIGTLVGCDLLGFGAMLIAVANSATHDLNERKQSNLNWRNV